MKAKIWILGLLIGVLPFYSCNDDDTEAMEESSTYNNNPFRVKRITGETKAWGAYELQFNYRPDGLLERVWRFGNIPYTETRDTMGTFEIEYDLNEHDFKVLDYVVTIEQDSADKLKVLYPETYADTIKSMLKERTLYSTSLKDGTYKKTTCRPPLSVFGDYINLAGQTQMVENDADGKPLIVRCYEDMYETGGDNGKYERMVYKYELSYAGSDIVEATVCTPDSYSETSWDRMWKIAFSHYSGVLTGVESDNYKMRRSGNTVVVAEPGVNTTYTLNEYGLAVKIENTDGETANIEYEAGTGNFSDLYALPLDKLLGKVWIK